MNLYYEYLFRSGDLKYAVSLPYSLFVWSLVDNEKLVITIHSHTADTISVKHWKVDYCEKLQDLPNYTEYIIPYSELFTSDKIIVPGCRLLPYQEDLYKLGKVQSTDYPQSYYDEVEYLEKIDNMLNSVKHQMERITWLWEAFLRVYQININLYTTDKNYALSVFAPTYYNAWGIWKHNLLDYPGEIASELMFYQEYSDMAASEGKPVSWKQEALLPWQINNLYYC